MNKERSKFVICLSNIDHEDLEVWKVYRILPDQKADTVGCLRVIDESGEDYLYPSDCFAEVSIPNDVEEKLLATVVE